jgi:PcfJ-like protein
VEMTFMDPWSAMNDAGSQLRKWRRATLNTRQKKLFPDGITIKKWQSIKEIHDDISRQANKLEALTKQVMMPWSESYQKVHGARADNVRILLPRTNQVLVKWGKKQSHCVGSMYNDKMQRGDCVIAGVFIESDLKYCVRLEPIQPVDKGGNPKGWQLQEFRGQGNCWPEPEHAAAVLTALREAGVQCAHWENSGNGYGKSKIDDWDSKFAALMTDPPEARLAKKTVKNFTVEKKPDYNLRNDTVEMAQ